MCKPAPGSSTRVLWVSAPKVCRGFAGCSALSMLSPCALASVRRRKKPIESFVEKPRVRKLCVIDSLNM